MNNNLRRRTVIKLQMIGYEWLFLLAVPFISLFFEGFRRKLVARAQNRIGPPVWQPIYDVVKLWKKKPSTSRGYTNIFFVISPILYVVSTFALFLFIPFSFIAFQYDFILLIYIVLKIFRKINPLKIFSERRMATNTSCVEMIPILFIKIHHTYILFILSSKYSSQTIIIFQPYFLSIYTVNPMPLWV